MEIQAIEKKTFFTRVRDNWRENREKRREAISNMVETALRPMVHIPLGLSYRMGEAVGFAKGVKMGMRLAFEKTDPVLVQQMESAFLDELRETVAKIEPKLTSDPLYAKRAKEIVAHPFLQAIEDAEEIKEVAPIIEPGTVPAT